MAQGPRTNISTYLESKSELPNQSPFSSCSSIESDPVSDLLNTKVHISKYLPPVSMSFIELMGYE